MAPTNLRGEGNRVYDEISEIRLVIFSFKSSKEIFNCSCITSPTDFTYLLPNSSISSTCKVEETPFIRHSAAKIISLGSNDDSIGEVSYAYKVLFKFKRPTCPKS